MKNLRKKRPKPQKNVREKRGTEGVVENKNEEDKRKQKALEALVEVFSLSSIKEASIAYDIAGGDLGRASEVLRKSLSDKSEDSFSCFSYGSSSSSSSGSSGGGSSSSGLELGSKERVQNCGDNVVVGCFKGGRQKKKVVASTGTVSTVLGKEYVRRNNIRNKGFSADGGFSRKAETEKFLCSMLGDDTDLNLAVVRDVLCQCGHDIERTIDRRSECTSLSWEGYLSDNSWSLGPFARKYAEVLNSSKADSAISPGCIESDIPQMVLESLFNFHKISEHDKDTMNWRNVVKKIQSLGPGFNVFSHVAESQQRTYAKGDEYHVFREDPNQHWDSVKSYYKKAATAYAKGDRAYAANLSDQGKEQTKLAQEADTRASHDIFIARNKGIENVITIDLRGQHVKQAMRMLKLHLLFGSYVPSVRTLRVITGCGSHGVGKAKLKQSVVSLLDREAIEWRKENQGTVLIKLNGWREYSFLDANSDSDSND